MADSPAPPTALSSNVVSGNWRQKAELPDRMEGRSEGRAGSRTPQKSMPRDIKRLLGRQRLSICK